MEEAYSLFLIFMALLALYIFIALFKTTAGYGMFYSKNRGWSRLVFAWWTFANLAPRAAALHRIYELEFGEEFKKEERKKIIPFIY